MAVVSRIKDGRCIGIEIIEIKSFPSNEFEDGFFDSKSNIDYFLQLIKEFQTQYCGKNAFFEILWVTNPVIGQAYNSEIKIYLILREMGTDDLDISSNLRLLSGNIRASLKVMNYTVEITEDDASIKKLFAFVDNDHVVALRKKEKMVISSSSLPVIYYNDILANDKYESFDNLVSRLSELRDCAVSFQIAPIEPTMQERLAIGEAASIYNSNLNTNWSSGRNLMLELPIQSINSYYQACSQGSIYAYNIIVFGRKDSTDSLTTRIRSMLKGSGNTQAEFDIIDISKLKINLYSDRYIYPWNAKSYINKIVSKSNCNEMQMLFNKMCSWMSEKEVLNFFRLPVYSRGLLSLNSENLFFVSEQIDSRLLDADNIILGSANTVNGVLELGCRKEQFAKHALIVGTPGTGKTTFSLNLLLQFQKKSIPFLAIEPTKTEYRALIEKIEDLQIFTPGNNEISPFIVNPFIPPRGIKVEQYIPALVSAFGAAFSMESPLDVIFLNAIRTAYIEYGWKDYSKFGDPDVKEFGLYEFVLIFKKIVRESNYSREVKGNLESAGTFRLMNLIEQNGNIYDTINNVPIEDLLTKPTILELNSIQDESQKALIIALLLTNICLYTKLIQRGDGGLKNAILIDEAHVLLGNSVDKGDKSNPKGKAIDSLKSMIAEIRSYGTSIIIADQSAKMVSREIVANTDIKIAFRLVEAEEKEILGNSINADEKIKNQMSKLKVGEAFVFLSLLERPQLVQTPDIREQEGIRLAISDDEVVSKMKYWELHKELLRPFRECTMCDLCQNECDYYVRADANFYSNKIYANRSAKITDVTEFARHIISVENFLNSLVPTYEKKKRERLISCCMIQLRRKVQMETNLRLTDAEMNSFLERRSSQNDSYDGNER